MHHSGIPELIIESNYVRVDAVVNLERGFGPFIGLSKFVSEAGSYGKRIYLRSYADNSIVQLDSLLKAMSVSTPKGEKLEVIVLGNDRAAERMALRIYSGLTSEDSENPDFERFEEN